MYLYILQTQEGKHVSKGSLTENIKKVMEISKEVGNIPEVTYDKEMEATCFEFEGYYCNFKLYLS